MRIRQTMADLLDSLRELPVPMYATDPQGQIVLWNAAMQALTAIEPPPHSRPGALLTMVCDFVPQPGDNPLLDQVLQSGKPLSLVDSHLSWATPAGERAVDFFGEPIMDADNHVQGALAVVRDKTRERTLEKALDGFERTAGHDLRNAVGVLEGYVPLLISGEAARMEDGGQAIFQTLMRTSRLLQSIIHLMLVNARHARVVAAGPHESMLLREVFMTACRAVEPTAANKDVCFDSKVPVDLLIDGNPDALQAAIVNVLYAATKLSRNRAPIELRATVAGDRVEVEVGFVGKAIDPTEVERMFSALGQPQDPRFGIGVSVCLARLLLRLYGSDLHLSARPVDANVFVFHLPLRIEVSGYKA